MNKKSLVILESPAKAKTIQKYLGANFKVICTEGHITNLSHSGFLHLGINLTTFTPEYKIIKAKQELVATIKKLCQRYPKIILATDPDREGEAIAYHINKTLAIEKKSVRVFFNSITQVAIVAAFAKETTINLSLVAAQETRRMVDRMIGFPLSRLLQKKIKSKSAGRVQSVALKLIAEREKQRQNFTPTLFWTINGLYNECPVTFSGLKNSKTKLVISKQFIEQLKQQLVNNRFTVEKITKKESVVTSPKPFITATILQTSANLFNYPVWKTTRILQQLYEGKKIKKGLTGLITYPRTDSYRIDRNCEQQIITFIKTNYGSEFIGKNFQFHHVSKSRIQDAHEAIRVTDVKTLPNTVKPYLTIEQYKIYQLIWQRTVAAYMSNSVKEIKYFQIINGGYVFEIITKKFLFLGFEKVWLTKVKLHDLELKLHQKISLNHLTAIESTTKPISKFSEASLIKTLEALGIGRPSTYAPIITVLINRGYIYIEHKSINISEKGLKTNKMIQMFFNSIITENYTSQMEEQLNLIAQDKLTKEILLKNFWAKFYKLWVYSSEHMPTIAIDRVGISCPRCQNDLVYRYGRYGKFIACSGFPKCRYIFHDTIATIWRCPECKLGYLWIKGGRKGNKSLACSNYLNEQKCRYFEAPSKSPRCKALLASLLSVVKPDKQIVKLI